MRDSLLNSSKFFHIVDGLVPDVMHDILEGILQYEVKELLKYFFIHTKKYFTLDELNKKITEFPYVLSDKAIQLLQLHQVITERFVLTYFCMHCTCIRSC